MPCIKCKKELQSSFDTMINNLSKEHEAALKKRDETYNHATSYLKQLIESLEKKNAALMTRMKDVEARADVAEKMREESDKRREHVDKRRHQVFWGMLAALILVTGAFLVALFSDAVV